MHRNRRIRRPHRGPRAAIPVAFQDRPRRSRRSLGRIRIREPRPRSPGRPHRPSIPSPTWATSWPTCVRTGCRAIRRRREATGTPCSIRMRRALWTWTWSTPFHMTASSAACGSAWMASLSRPDAIGPPRSSTSRRAARCPIWKMPRSTRTVICTSAASALVRMAAIWRRVPKTSRFE